MCSVEPDGQKPLAFCSHPFSVTWLSSPGEQALPIAIAGRDVVVQPGTVIVLNGVESMAVGGAHITDYQWTLQRGNDSVSMEV